MGGVLSREADEPEQVEAFVWQGRQVK